MLDILKNVIFINIIPLSGIAIVFNEYFKMIYTRVCLSVNVLFGTNIYYFFENYSCPFPAHSLNLEDPHSSKPVLAYCLDKYTFFPYMCDITEYKHSKLPILSLEILGSDGNIAHDLTDYIEKIRYISKIPTIMEILICWTIHSGIVINHKKYTIRYINDEGEIIEGLFEKLHSE